jgi:O-methyltransferase
VHTTVPDRQFYTPLFSPWHGYGDFAPFLRLAEPYTLLTPDGLYVLYAFALNAARLPGEFWECGVYKGGSARMLAEIINLRAEPERPRLRLFDTFAGLPETDKQADLHHRGDFADTSFAGVRKLLGQREDVVFHPGRIPETSPEWRTQSLPSRTSTSIFTTRSGIAASSYTLGSPSGGNAV